jgi:hypothetical protein
MAFALKTSEMAGGDMGGALTYEFGILSILEQFTVPAGNRR